MRRLLITALMLASASAAHAQATSRSFYDGRGSFAGRLGPARQVDLVLRRARPLFRQLGAAWQLNQLL
jgi:hypothetical protein